MFITSESTVDVLIYYKKKGFHYLAYSENDFKEIKESFSSGEESEYKVLNVKMKQLSWGLYNELQEGATDTDLEGNRIFNYKKYKELRLTKLIVGWDAKTIDKRNGQEIDVRVTDQTIKSLAPEIAETILTAYDSVVYMTEEEEKK